jgi:hypothetical protein
VSNLIDIGPGTKGIAGLFFLKQATTHPSLAIVPHANPSIRTICGRDNARLAALVPPATGASPCVLLSVRTWPHARSMTLQPGPRFGPNQRFSLSLVALQGLDNDMIAC